MHQRRATTSAVGGRLDPVELGVLSAERHESAVRSDLGDAGTVEHDNEVCHAHRREGGRHAG